MLSMLACEACIVDLPQQFLVLPRDKGAHIDANCQLRLRYLLVSSQAHVQTEIAQSEASLRQECPCASSQLIEAELPLLRPHAHDYLLKLFVKSAAYPLVSIAGMDVQATVSVVGARDL